VVHVSYFHHLATDIVVVRELFHFNLLQTSEPIDTKLGRHVQWKILNKVYVFSFIPLGNPETSQVFI